ncbi:hypothetical protein WAF17_22075 [Bernardetia sp. ABR2-2B]|uniref:hypothetical protein n=1 Tax=Bernardetia sp. ABR2-2B TaxID=3127472 RepID=UPI0030CF7D94
MNKYILLFLIIFSSCSEKSEKNLAEFSDDATDDYLIIKDDSTKKDSIKIYYPPLQTDYAGINYGSSNSNQGDTAYFKSKDIPKMVYSSDSCLFFEEMQNLPSKEFSLKPDSLEKYLEGNFPYHYYLDREKFNWLYTLFEDKSNFEQIRYIKPIAKFYENDAIFSVAFSDVYDYKQAVHIINFSKKRCKPISSFILWDLSGDGGDVWRIQPQKINSTKFKVSNSILYNLLEVKNWIVRDTIYIREEQFYMVEIDKETAHLSISKLKTEKDFFTDTSVESYNSFDRKKISVKLEKPNR